MPSSSKKQHNFMDAIAHNPAFAKKVGVSQSVGKDFSAADKGKKFGIGGSVDNNMGGQKQINKQATRWGSELGSQKGVPNVNILKQNRKKEGGTVATKKLFGGKETFKEELAEGKAVKSGKISPMQYAMREASEKPKKMARGGGAESKGKTAGKMVKMARGGGVEIKGKTRGKCI